LDKKKSIDKYIDAVYEHFINNLLGGEERLIGVSKVISRRILRM